MQSTPWCTSHDLRIVSNLRPVFALLSLLGVAVYWWGYLLGAAMACDAFVVQFRRRSCAENKSPTSPMAVRSGGRRKATLTKTGQ